MKLSCERCGAQFERRTAEVNRSRRLGRKQYCGSSCSALVSNEQLKSRPLELTCQYCGTLFASSTHNKAAKAFCSRVCASAGSMSESRREAQRIGGQNSVHSVAGAAALLKTREAWKYAALAERLGDEAHEFEFALGDFVFDLALFTRNTLIEFDGPEHQEPRQQATDERKNQVAAAAGFRLVRRLVERNSAISIEVLADL